MEGHSWIAEAGEDVPETYAVSLPPAAAPPAADSADISAGPSMAAADTTAPREYAFRRTGANAAAAPLPAAAALVADAAGTSAAVLARPDASQETVAGSASAAMSEPAVSAVPAASAPRRSSPIALAADMQPVTSSTAVLPAHHHAELRRRPPSALVVHQADSSQGSAPIPAAPILTSESHSVAPASRAEPSMVRLSRCCIVDSVRTL